jgi:hypothetical protein
MSIRRVSRIVLSVVVLGGLWYRTWREWSARSSLWLGGLILLSAILILVVIIEATGMQQKWQKQRDEVPKNPLGLDA